MTVSQLPYGVGDLDPDVEVHPDDRDLVRCYVRGCRHFVRRPTRRRRGELCPEHGIYCHHSRYGSTYSYADVRRNIIASPDLFAQRIVGHPFKYESHRLGSENSEDALSWNVFRSLQEAGCLARVAKLLIGEDHEDEPRLYMWGIRVDDDSFEPWDLLIAARERFESNLPIKRPLTEPDIAMHLPGKYLVLIEAKFTSPNPVYRRGPRKDEQSLTLDELLDIYWDPSLRILDYAEAREKGEIHYQLWRNMVFAEWMASVESRATRAYHLNLVRSQQEITSAAVFGHLISSQLRDRFRRRSWEDLASAQLVNSSDCGSRLMSYFEKKTAHLSQVFRISRSASPPTERNNTMSSDKSEKKSPEEMDRYFDSLDHGPGRANCHEHCDTFVETRDFITAHLALQEQTGNGSTSWPPQPARWKLNYYDNHPMLFGLRRTVARNCPQLYGMLTSQFPVNGVPFVGIEVDNNKDSFDRIQRLIESARGRLDHTPKSPDWIRRLLKDVTESGEFAIFSGNGEQITGRTEEEWLENWLRLAPPAGNEAQWRDSRSAKELARAWFPGNCGPDRLPHEISSLLSLKGFRPFFAIAEFRAELDGFTGNSRNHDLLIFGELASSRERALVAIEAKADEPFGPLIAEYREKGEAKQGSKIPDRIDRLVNSLFGQMSTTIGSLRYQLLHAIGSALIEGRRFECKSAILIVHEFQSAACSPARLDQNASDLNRFVRLLCGDDTLKLTPGKLIEPIRVPGDGPDGPAGHVVPGDLPLCVGKVVTTLPRDRRSDSREDHSVETDGGQVIERGETEINDGGRDIGSAIREVSVAQMFWADKVRDDIAKAIRLLDSNPTEVERLLRQTHAALSKYTEVQASLNKQFGQ